MAGVHCQMTKIAHYFWVAQCVLLWAMALLTPLTYAQVLPTSIFNAKDLMVFYVVLSWFFFFILSIAHFLARLSNDENCTLFLGGPNSPYLQALCLNMLKALWGSMYVTYISWFFFFILWEWPFFSNRWLPQIFFVFYYRNLFREPNKYWGEILYQGAMT